MSEVIEITLRSLIISFSATVMSSLWSVLVALFLSIRESRVSRVIVSFFNSMVGIPTVVVGLILYMLLSRSGPFGFMEILYTPYAIIIGEAILVSPWIVSLSYEVFTKSRSTYWELAISLGADEFQAYMLMIREAMPDIIVIFLMAFSRAIGELGVALLVGGNIKGYTRVLTTSIALAVARGEFELAIALGLMLVLILFTVFLMVRLLKVYRE